MSNNPSGIVDGSNTCERRSRIWLDIATFERPEDKHCYMIYEYADGVKVPSWLVSDGTLRLTALTLPAYLVDLQGIYLIEEPGERDSSQGRIDRLRFPVLRV